MRLKNVYVYINVICTRERMVFLYRNSEIKRCEERGWTFPDAKIHNQIGHILIGDVIRVLSMYSLSEELPLILTCRCKFREKLLVSKQAALKFDMERFNFVN